MNKLILNQLADGLYAIGEGKGFSKPIIRTDRYNSEIYIVHKHAIQIEIDWLENNLFMYVVYLENDKLPDKSVIYYYNNGHWCRKFLEEIYGVKRPYAKDSCRRYSPEYLFDCFEFYRQLISSDPVVLMDFFTSNNT